MFAMEFTLELESTPTHKLELELADWLAQTLVVDLQLTWSSSIWLLAQL